MTEISAVGHKELEIFAHGRVIRYGDLESDTVYERDGLTARTLPDIGAVLSRVTTVNDVHFGEIECGKVDGSTPAQFTVGPGEEPYPEVMNRAVIADMFARQPDRVIVRGDLTSFGTSAEYESFLSFYEPAFGERLVHVRGNHDSYPGERFAAWPVQIIDVAGLRIVLLDTSRDHFASGFVDDDQVAAVREAVSLSTTPVMVMGHHPLFVPGEDDPRRFDGVEPSQSRHLLEAMRESGVVAYSAGHTHRSRRRDVDGVVIIEVACVKDFPGAWGELVIGERGIAHVVHRASDPAAVAWAEKTRGMFDGWYGDYAAGELSDRCFVLPTS